jgi:protein O-GlcNAc transferase
MNDERKRGSLFGRLARGLRSNPAASENDGARTEQYPGVPAAGIAGAPSSASDLINQGLIRRARDGAAAALPLFEQAAELAPNSYMPFLMLGNATSELDELDRAATYFERARDLEPNNHVVRYNLGINHLWRGYIQLAIEELQTACRLHPSYDTAHTALIMALHSSDLISPEEIVNYIRRWAARFALQHPASASSLTPDRALQRKLRVGFVSGDFRLHSVAHFFEPILNARNHDAFEYHLYHNSPQRDAVTERLRTGADAWHDVWQLSDEALIELIRADRIDMLVDLSGHTEGNRLSVFARRAAAVQLTYLGFPNSSGLATMDYRITDIATDEYPLADGWHSETLLRLPDAQWCFRPFGTPPAVGPLPARSVGYVTFGSFNNFSKASDRLLRCWTEILVRSPTSRLRLTRVRSPHRAREIVALFEKSGIAAERIECVPYRSAVPHGAQFAGVDIGLDHYPYNGVTTTCESLYVGVPVISLHGRNCVSRSGLSILNTLGLGELVASTADQYVNIAIGLANDLPRLELLRSGLRSRFEHSPLRAEKRFAASFEQLLRYAWQQYLVFHG